MRCKIGICCDCGRKASWICKGRCTICYKYHLVNLPEEERKRRRKRRLEKDHYGHHGSPALPVNAPPGSELKIQALAERASLGISLWHPRDLALPQE